MSQILTIRVTLILEQGAASLCQGLQICHQIIGQDSATALQYPFNGAERPVWGGCRCFQNETGPCPRWTNFTMGSAVRGSGIELHRAPDANSLQKIKISKKVKLCSNIKWRCPSLSTYNEFKLDKIKSYTWNFFISYTFYVVSDNCISLFYKVLRVGAGVGVW